MAEGKRCSLCVMSESYPGLTFDEDGICQVRCGAKQDVNADWIEQKRELEKRISNIKCDCSLERRERQYICPICDILYPPETGFLSLLMILSGIGDRRVGICRVYLSSAHLACKPNKLLTCKLHRYLTANMHDITADVSQADFVILNTCGFTQEAEDHTIMLLKGYVKNAKRDTRIISVGCLNRIAPEVFEKELENKVVVLKKESHLDRFFKNKIAYDDVREEYIEEENVRELNAELYNRSVGLYYYLQSAVRKAYPLLKKSAYLERLFNEIDQTNKSFVQIGTGCVGNCSYCIIKKARGNPVSRDVGDILEDIGRVYTPGKSVYLVADDCGSYGCDIGLSLPFLLRKIHEAHPELTIDLNYVNPVWLEKEEEEFLKTFEEVRIGSVNVSIQSGSNRIIKKMNRQYDVRRIRTIVKKLKETSPSTHLWTHCIVGFPGETWLDFLKTVRLVHILHFVYTFGYSDRTGTESSRMSFKNSKSTILIKKLLIRSYAISMVFVRGTGDLVKTTLSRPRRRKSLQNSIPQYNAQSEEDVT